MQTTPPQTTHDHDALTAKADALKAELPGVTFGYIGNCGYDRSGYFDDRSWRIFLPHPGRVGTYADCVGSYSTARLGDMLRDWDRLAAQARTAMARRPAADVGDDATYELSLTNLDGTVGTSQIPGRALAETCLREFAQGAGLDVHIHPTVYTDGSRSTAFRRGGDSLYDAVAMLRRLF